MILHLPSLVALTAAPAVAAAFKCLQVYTWKNKRRNRYVDFNFALVCYNLILVYFPRGVGSGPFLEVLQDQADPWRSRSKLRDLLLSSKISLISLVPSGDRIRY